MEQLIEAIRAATAPDAGDDVRAAGATACRSLLAALDAKPGEPIALAAPVPAQDQPALDGPQLVAHLVGAIRGMPPERLLDLAIDRLRRALPAPAAAPVVAPVKFQILPLPPRART